MWFSGGAVAGVGSGAAWTQYNDLPDSQSWKTVQYAPFAIDYVILGDDAGDVTNNIVASVDATTWTAYNASRSQEWAFSVYGGGYLYAAQKSGSPSFNIYSTQNMLDWNSHSIVTFAAGNAVEINELLYADGKLIIIGKVGDEGIVLAGVVGTTSPWPNVRWPDAQDFNPRGIDYNGTGTYLLVGGSVSGNTPTPTNIIYRQQGEVTDAWEEITLPTSLNWTQVKYGNGRWVVWAGGSSTVAISTNDGDTWTTATLPVAFSNNFEGLAPAKAAFGLDRFHYYAGNRIYTSSDGVLWSRSDASYSFTNITDWDFSAGIGLAVGTRSTGNHSSYLKYSVA